MQPKSFSIDRTYREDDPAGSIVAWDEAQELLGEELWKNLSGDWTAVRRTPVSRRVFSDLGPARYIVVSAGFEIMPIDAREYVVVPAAPQPDPVVYKQDWRLVAVILGLALLVVLFAVM